MRALLISLPLCLAACAKTGGVDASGSPSAAMPAGWQTPVSLTQVPVRALRAVPIEGKDWQSVAALLSLDPAQFSQQSWGAYPVQAHRDGAINDVAVYLHDAGNQGFIVRARRPGKPGARQNMRALAKAEGRGESWTWYTGGDYTYLVSNQSPVVEIGCMGLHDDAACHVAILPASYSLQDWEGLPDNLQNSTGETEQF